MVNVSGLSLLPASARKKPLIVRAVKAAIQRLPGEVNVIVVDRAEMKRLNKRFLGHSHDTDVIAFNYEQHFPGAPFGDVYVSAHQAAKQAKALGHPVLKEVLTLVVHGSLHLIGYDDATPKAKARMFKKQDALIGELFR